MKKRIMICVCLSLLVVCFIGICNAKSSKIIGKEGIIEKDREEIFNLFEVDTIDMTIAGKSTIDNSRQLFWIITGNKYQMHRYYPLEVIETSEDEYEFVHLHNGSHPKRTRHIL